MSTRAIQIDFLLAGITDSSGNILAGGSVEFYSAGTDNAKNVWTEKEKTNPFTSYTLDASGAAQLYGDGIYKVLAKDSSGTLKRTWDNVKLRALNYSVVSKIASYDVTAEDDVILVDTSSGDVTLSFLAAASMVFPVIVLHIAGANDVILDPDGSETIDGSATYTFSSINSSVYVFSDGSNLRKAGSTALGLFAGASIELANTGLEIQDTGGDHTLTIKPNEDLTGDKTLSIVVGDGDRSVTLSGNPTLADWFDQAVKSTSDPTFNSMKLNDSNDSHQGTIFIGSDFTDNRTIEIKGKDGNFVILTGDVGSISYFGNASAPSGWTKKIDWQDGAMLVLNSDADGTALDSGGSVKPQSTHTHTTPNHAHKLPFGQRQSLPSVQGTRDAIYGTSGTFTSQYESAYGGAGFTHDQLLSESTNGGATGSNTAPYYQETIACTKD